MKAHFRLVSDHVIVWAEGDGGDSLKQPDCSVAEETEHVRLDFNLGPSVSFALRSKPCFVGLPCRPTVIEAAVEVPW